MVKTNKAEQIDAIIGSILPMKIWIERFSLAGTKFAIYKNPNFWNYSSTIANQRKGRLQIIKLLIIIVHPPPTPPPKKKSYENSFKKLI